MSAIIGLSWVLFAALWHSAALPVPGLLGVPADMLVLVVLLWSYLRSADQAILMAVAAGTTLDLMSSHPVGITALALLPAALLGSLRGARLLDTDWLSSVILVGLSTLIFHMLLLTMLRLSGAGPDFGLVWRDVLIAVMLNALLTPPLYLLVWLGSFDSRPSKRQIRTS